MGMTITEKIIAAHVVDGARRPGQEGSPEVWPGDLVEVATDVVLANDITAPISLREFEKLGVEPCSIRSG